MHVAQVDFETEVYMANMLANTKAMISPAADYMPQVGCIASRLRINASAYFQSVLSVLQLQAPYNAYAQVLPLAAGAVKKPK